MGQSRPIWLSFPGQDPLHALSLPYHIGNGICEGLLPLIGLSVCAATGNIYAGLYYPIIVAAITLVWATIFLRETHGVRIRAETEIS
jgi:hypothetical protein